jgi:hypothetical protein
MSCSGAAGRCAQPVRPTAMRDGLLIKPQAAGAGVKDAVREAMSARLEPFTAGGSSFDAAACGARLDLSSPISAAGGWGVAGLTILLRHDCGGSIRDSARQQHSILGFQPRMNDLPAQQRNVMRQHHQLNVLSCLATTTKDNKPEHRPRQRIHNRRGHVMIMPNTRGEPEATLLSPQVYGRRRCRTGHLTRFRFTSCSCARSGRSRK